MTRWLFVTGMFRSGTTLLARMLHAHRKMAIASDPFARVYKAFRNAAVLQAGAGGRGFCPDSPLGDYYYCPSARREHMAVRHASLRGTPTDTTDLPGLRRQVAGASGPFSPRIAEHLDLLDGANFAELLEQGVQIVRRAYGDADTAVAGCKEVWTTEFVPHVLEALPDARAIVVVRDPRAVCASNNVTEAKYPWIFLTRQWRKLAAIAWQLAQSSPAGQGRVMLLHYEDLIREPEQTARAMCEFIGVDFDPNLVDPRTFVDGAGEPWVQNSSHFDGKAIFNVRSLDKWRSALSEREVACVESVCAPEMRLLGYEPNVESAVEELARIATDPPHLPLGELSEWIRPFSPQTPGEDMRQWAMEHLRASLLNSPHDLPTAVAEAMCLDGKLLAPLRAAARNEPATA
ncbi:MAG: sulfotransferase family protein [Phycisphaerae bacterium]